MEVSFDADVAAEHGVRAAVVLNHIAHLMRFPDGSQAGHFKTCGRACNWYTLTETGNAVA